MGVMHLKKRINLILNKTFKRIQIYLSSLLNEPMTDSKQSLYKFVL